jgi:hypothetical protein
MKNEQTNQNAWLTAHLLIFKNFNKKPSANSSKRLFFLESE